MEDSNTYDWLIEIGVDGCEPIPLRKEDMTEVQAHAFRKSVYERVCGGSTLFLEYENEDADELELYLIPHHSFRYLKMAKLFETHDGKIPQHIIPKNL